MPPDLELVTFSLPTLQPVWRGKNLRITRLVHHNRQAQPSRQGSSNDRESYLGQLDDVLGVISQRSRRTYVELSHEYR